MLGIASSTVAGKLRIVGRSGVGSQTSMTALADLECEIEFGPGEALGRVFEDIVGPGRTSREALDLGARRGRRSRRSRPVEPEHDAALNGRGRVVEVDDGARRPTDRFESPLDQFVPGLRQDADCDVFGDALLLDQLAHEVEVDL